MTELLDSSLHLHATVDEAHQVVREEEWNLPETNILGTATTE